jgi:hypothetical protein
MSLDGVIDAPTWTFDYGFDPQMGEAIGGTPSERLWLVRALPGEAEKRDRSQHRGAGLAR